MKSKDKWKWKFSLDLRFIAGVIVGFLVFAAWVTWRAYA